MHIETIQLWDEFPQVTLTAYIPYDVVIDDTKQATSKPAMLILPGGAYLYTSDREAEPIAMRFASLGFRTFVLHYNTYYGAAPITEDKKQNPNPHVKFPQPLYDAAKAMVTIRSRAAEWNINPNHIAVAGFSAGGHLAASLGVHWNREDVLAHLDVQAEQVKPNALILGYALIDNNLAIEWMTPEDQEKFTGLYNEINAAMFGAQEVTKEALKELSPNYYVGKHTPPTFLWHTAEDDLVLSAHSLAFAMELCKQRIPYEMHVFETGGHGLALADHASATHQGHLNAAAASWVELANRWMQRHFV